MARFAFCNGTGTIWQFDSANPSVAPSEIHAGESNIHSIALTTGQEFQLGWGPGQREIRKTQGAQTDMPEYTHSTYVLTIRVRSVAGTNRVYFSDKDPSSLMYRIYQLKNNKPVLYYTINPKLLTFPNPCDSTAPEWYGYSGDFAFGDGDNLYFSSGNLSGPKVGLEIGIYRVTGAGPDKVTGSLERIYLGDGPIEALCHQSPNTLYFLRRSDVRRFDLTTKTESPEGTIPPVEPAAAQPRDLSRTAPGTLHIGWTTFAEVMKSVYRARPPK
jgi:hypothetical protein